MGSGTSEVWKWGSRIEMSLCFPGQWQMMSPLLQGVQGEKQALATQIREGEWKGITPKNKIIGLLWYCWHSCCAHWGSLFSSPQANRPCSTSKDISIPAIILLSTWLTHNGWASESLNVIHRIPHFWGNYIGFPQQSSYTFHVSFILSLNSELV